MNRTLTFGILLLSIMILDGCIARYVRRATTPVPPNLISRLLPQEESQPEQKSEVWKYRVVVPKAARAPTIDGALPDECWKKAATLEKFVLVRASVPRLLKSLGGQVELKLPRDEAGDYLAVEPTRVKICADVHALYIGAECKDAERITKSADPKEIALKDDCLQFLIDTRENLFLITVNSKGRRLDKHLASVDEKANLRKWIPSITARCRVTEKGWCWEAAIPFASLKTRYPKRGDYFGINICRRNQPPLRIGGSKLERTSTWVPVVEDLFELENLGKMYFFRFPEICIVRLAAGTCGIGYNTATVTLENMTTKPIEARVLLSAIDDDGKTIETVSRWLKLREREKRDEYLTYLIPQKGKPCCLSVTVLDEQGDELTGSESLPLEVPESLMNVSIERKEFDKGVPTVPVSIRLNIGDLSLPDYIVKLRLVNEQGQIVGEDEVTPPESGSFVAELSTSQLLAGSYELTLQLEKDDTVQEKARLSFRLR